VGMAGTGPAMTGGCDRSRVRQSFGPLVVRRETDKE